MISNILYDEPISSHIADLQLPSKVRKKIWKLILESTKKDFSKI